MPRVPTILTTNSLGSVIWKVKIPFDRSRIILNSVSRKRMGSVVPHLRSVKVRRLTKYASALKGESPNKRLREDGGQ